VTTTTTASAAAATKATSARKCVFYVQWSFIRSTISATNYEATISTITICWNATRFAISYFISAKFKFISNDDGISFISNEWTSWKWSNVLTFSTITIEHANTSKSIGHASNN